MGKRVEEGNSGVGSSNNDDGGNVKSEQMRRREVGTRQCDRVRWDTPTVMPQPKDGRTDLLGYRRPTERMVSCSLFYFSFYLLFYSTRSECFSAWSMVIYMTEEMGHTHTSGEGGVGCCIAFYFNACIFRWSVWKGDTN